MLNYSVHFFAILTGNFMNIESLLFIFQTDTLLIIVFVVDKLG